MDTQGLKYRKRQKKTKAGTDKMNSNVLVVPPDILKKLGINIGTLNLNYQFSETGNPNQDTGIQMNESIADIQIADVNTKSSESSILETADLMKKSVFLSPTFVPTVVNTISGEVEISNIQNRDDSRKATDALPLENRKLNNVYCESIYMDTQDQESNKNNGFTRESEIQIQQVKNDLNMEGTNIKNDEFLNRLSVEGNQDSKSVINNDCDLMSNEKVIAQNDLNMEGTNIKNYEFLNTLSEEGKHDSKSVINNDCNLMSNEKVIAQRPSIEIVDQTSKFKSNGAIPFVAKKTIEVDIDKTENDLISLKESEIAINETDDEINSGKVTMPIYEIDDENNRKMQLLQHHPDFNCNIPDIKAIQYKQDVVEDNSSKNENANIEKPSKNLISIETINSKPVEVKSDIITLEDEESHLKQDENETIGLQNKTTNKFSINNCNLIPMGDNKLLHNQNIIKSGQANIIHNKQIWSEIDITSFENPNMEIEHNEDDTHVKCLNLAADQVDIRNNNTYPDDEVTVTQNISRDLKHSMRETVLTENKKFKSINFSTSEAPRAVKHLNTNKMQKDCEMKHNSKNIALDECDDILHLCNGNVKETAHIGSDLNKVESIHGIVEPVAKVLQKINILSEEIIPPLDLKDRRMTSSPVINSLTPVTLNSIIAPKRNCGYGSESKLMGEIRSKISLNEPEVQASEISHEQNTDIFSFRDQVDSACGLATISTEENVLPNQDYDGIFKKAKLPLSFYDNLKNKNTKHSEQLIIKDYKTCLPNEALVNQSNNKIHDLHTSQIVSNCSQASIEVIGSTQNHHHIDENFHNSFKEVEKFVTEKNSKDQFPKKKKKQKKINQSEIVEVICPDDKESFNSQINEIVKSHKENSDINVNLGKVKAIAEHIKKYVNICKNNKLRISKFMASKKDTIHSKSNMIKSKMCIQGVEKPGGSNSENKNIKNTKFLKTYIRQNKCNKPSKSGVISTSNKIVPCRIYDKTDIELNIVNNTMSCKSQDFCLCYDFGRLDVSMYNNSYEHIHFWLRDKTADLESTLSIYNDEEVMSNDRTKLDCIKINEVTALKTETRNICWNYFLNNQKESQMTEETSNEMHFLNDILTCDLDVTINNNTQLKETDSLIKNHSGSDLRDTDKEMSIDISVINDETNSLKLLTIEKLADSQHLEAVKTNDMVNADKKLEDVSNTNSKSDYGEPGTSESSGTIRLRNEEMSIHQPESSNRGRRKRSLQADDNSEEPCPKKNVKCGVCNKLLIEAEWKKHIAHKHNYIAWKAGQSFDFDNQELLRKLRRKYNTMGSLKCPNCRIQTSKFNKFIGHIKSCINQKETSSRRASSSQDMVKCGVCYQKVQKVSWNEHIGKEHNYLAWIDGKEILDLEDEAAVTKYLQSIIKCYGQLVCSKCGLSRKRVKLYLSHIETCDGSENRVNVSSVMDATNTQEETTNEPTLDKKSMRCGVCKQEVPLLKWTEHVGKEHNYLAWDDGSTPLDLNDEEVVRNHLQEFVRQYGGLRCYKCGINRKRAKVFLSHIANCNGEEVNLDESTLQEISMERRSRDAKTFECAVCNTIVSILDWYEHIGREHNYLAWKVGDTPLNVNDEDAVKEHLLDIIRSCEGLICYKCGLSRRRAKVYLSHIQTCVGGETAESNMDQSTTSNLNFSVTSNQIEISINTNETIFKCGVCDADVAATMWIEHIGREHKYLAWQVGEEPLDLDSEESVKAHLLVISRQNNGLICYLCDVTKKYPKSFMTHIKNCTGVLNTDQSVLEDEPEINSFDIKDVTTDTVICGVCNKVVVTVEWMNHMEKDHDYMAWLQGRPPLDLNDSAVVQRHLMEVSKRTGGLKCKNCGLIRKYVKSYMGHIEYCKTGRKIKDCDILKGKDSVTCAVCSAMMEPKDWRDHAMKQHYNVAWIVGATPIEINNPYGVEPYIKEYQQRHSNKLVCKTCGISRVSAVGFYAHIITCGKTDEETEIYKGLCDVCNCKYLRIYRSQHMTMHREKEHALERKLLIAKEKELKKEEDKPVMIVGGRRKAAEKAQTVIEKYTSNQENGSYCSKCGFSSEVESEMLAHVCVNFNDGSESDESVKIDCNSDEDDDTDFDSNVSDEEREARNQEQSKSKKHGDSSSSNKVKRLPYQVANLNAYMKKSAEEFVALHLTDEDLFSQYRNLEYRIIPETDLPKYMPAVEQSCKVRYREDGSWRTYERFEAKAEKDLITIFTGSCIQNMCWVPPCVGAHDNASSNEYLSVLSSLTSDIPKHYWYERPARVPALIQIWDCGNFKNEVPELAMGLGLDYGVIWAIDWCPSGARDVFDSVDECKEVRRLGLLAAACANGSAYVFAVPHPSTIKEKKQFYKLHPVAELRLAMDASRKLHQATAIKWSVQKGHALIVVGYADGTTAYFDIKTESPLLKSTENGIEIIYPYDDVRAQNMCIEDVDVFPSAETTRSAGAVVVGSVGGAGGRHSHAHAAAARVRFPPHWPAALLAGDDTLVSQAINEVEWYGQGRRVGGMRALGGCAWSGRLAASSAPLVRLLRAHPAYSELHRQVIATLQMVPIGSKRKRKNDELSMIMEPLTYNEAILKYGIELKQITARDKITQQRLSGLPREAYPERFPLAEVTSIVFCPTYKNQNKLAMSTHAGLIFIMNV